MDLLEEDSDDGEQQKRARVEDLKYSCKMEIRFASAEAARNVMLALQVDEELTPSKVERTMDVKDEYLIVEVRATEVRLLRASTASFFDMAMVAVRFLCEFA
jgi:tRNA threonylcarbamoyladenosine modification (KEOPS) complex  Pcc1 subunit